MHAFPSATVTAGSLLLMVVARHGAPPLSVALRGLVVVAASQTAVGALNDYMDRHEDALTQPEKPIPAGELRPGVALLMVAGGVAVCCSFALTFGLTSLAIASLGLWSGLAYDLGLKRTLLSPLPYVVSFLSLVSWIWFVNGALSPALLVMFPPAACVVVAAHLANALPDVDTDARLGHRSLAVILGPVRALRLVLAVTAGAVGCGLVLSLAARSAAATLLSLLGALLLVAAAVSARRSRLDRPALQRFFRLVAPSIMLSGASCLLGFQAMF